MIEAQYSLYDLFEKWLGTSAATPAPDGHRARQCADRTRIQTRAHQPDAGEYPGKQTDWQD